jgi:hypothetical protein
MLTKLVLLTRYGLIAPSVALGLLFAAVPSPVDGGVAAAQTRATPVTATPTPTPAPRPRSSQPSPARPMPTPRPTVEKPPPRAAPPISVIPAPSGLTSTDDPKICGWHVPANGEKLCAEAIEAGKVVLIWEPPWACPNVDCTPDGYRVYKDDLPTPALAYEVWDSRAAMFPYPSAPWPLSAGASEAEKQKWQVQAANCYTVRAFKQVLGESPDSNSYCLKPQPIVLRPEDKLARFVREWDGTDDIFPSDLSTKGCAYFIDLGGAPSDAIAVGLHAEYDNDDFDYCTLHWRGAVWFNLSQVDKKPIAAATLTFDLLKTDTSGIASNEQVSCAAQLMLGTDDWMYKDYGDQKITIPAEDYLKLQQSVGSIPHTLSVDVTKAVQAWLQGARPNQGFVLRTYDESLPHGVNKTCMSAYGNFRLKLTFQ